MSRPYTLADVRSDKLTIHCEQCHRTGVYGVANLVTKYGADIMLPDLKDRIVADANCYRAASMTEPCQARYTRDTVMSWVRDEDRAAVEALLRGSQ